MFFNWWFQRSQYCLVKYIFQTALGESGALDVLDSFQVPCKPLSRLQAQRFLFVFGKFLDGGRVVAQINLRSN